MRFALLTAALLVSCSGIAFGQEHPGAHAMTPDQVKWGPAPPVLPKGAQAAVLSGDPGKPGTFTLRLKTPAGYKIGAHSHPTAEAVTVLSGAFHIGMGDKLDEAKTEKLGPGGFADLPANMNHYAFTSEETVVQVASEGPFGIKYVNPADDPSRTQ